MSDSADRKAYVADCLYDSNTDTMFMPATRSVPHGTRHVACYERLMRCT